MLLCTCEVCVVTSLMSELEEVWGSERAAAQTILLHFTACLGCNKGMGILPYKYPVQI